MDDKNNDNDSILVGRFLSNKKLSNKISTF